MTQTTLTRSDLDTLYDSVAVGDPNPTDATIDKDEYCTGTWMEKPRVGDAVARYCTRFPHAEGQHVAEGPTTVLAVKEFGR